MSLSFDALSESVSVSDIEDWQGDFTTNGKLAYIKQYYQLGKKLDNGWQISLTHRINKNYSYDPETANVYKHFKDSTHPISDTKNNIILSVSQYTASGLKLGRWLSISPQHKLLLNIELLKAQDLVYGQITGQATVSAEDDYNYQLNTDYAYSRDVLFGRTSVIPPEGIGFAVGFSLKGSIYKNLTYLVEVKDAAGYIHWPNAPYTVGNVTPQSSYIDDQGYLQTEPSISGQDGYKTFNQPLISELNANIHFLTPSLGYTLLYHASGHFEHSGLGIDTWITPDTRLSTSYWPTIQKLVIGAEYGTWKLETGFTQGNLNKTKVAQISLSLNMPN